MTDLCCACQASSKEHKLVLIHDREVRHQGHSSFSGNCSVVSLIRGFQDNMPCQRPNSLPALTAMPAQMAPTVRSMA